MSERTLVASGRNGTKVWAEPNAITLEIDVGERELDQDYALVTVIKQVRFSDRETLMALRDACIYALHKGQVKL